MMMDEERENFRYLGRLSKDFNLKKGLFRLWLLITGLWIAFAAVTLILDGVLPALPVILLIIGAPVLLLALGAATIWVVHGFGPLFGKNQATAPATNHQQFRWRRSFIVFILMVATVATTIA